MAMTAMAVLKAVVADDAATLTSRTENCYHENGNKWCEWNDVTLLTLLPAGQTISLLMKDDSNQVRGTLRLSMNALTTNCNARTEGWLRSYEIKTELSKRCPGMGSCKDQSCSQITIDTAVDELSAFNMWPGNSYCSAHCSTWWCGCPVPPMMATYVTACLFYRTYALPTSNITYEIFSCPTWDQHIVTSIEFESAEGNNSVTVELHPGMKFPFGNLSITPLSLSQAPAPVMGQRFITDGENVVLKRKKLPNRPRTSAAAWTRAPARIVNPKKTVQK
jgi:hypothetical protein